MGTSRLARPQPAEVVEALEAWASVVVLALWRVAPLEQSRRLPALAVPELAAETLEGLGLALNTAGPVVVGPLPLRPTLLLAALRFTGARLAGAARTSARLTLRPLVVLVALGKRSRLVVVRLAEL